MYYRKNIEICKYSSRHKISPAFFTISMWSQDSLTLVNVSSSHQETERCHLCGMRSEFGLCSAAADSSPYPGGINIKHIPEMACRWNLRSSAAQEAIDSEAQHGWWETWSYILFVFLCHLSEKMGFIFGVVVWVM